MLKLKVGDKVKVVDPSYVFGVKSGHYDELYHSRYDVPFEVVDVCLHTIIQDGKKMCNGEPAIADILITDNDGGFWFAQSRFVEKISHTVTFDGGEVIEISDESFEALKRTFSGS